MIMHNNKINIKCLFSYYLKENKNSGLMFGFVYFFFLAWSNQTFWDEQKFNLQNVSTKIFNLIKENKSN